MTDQVVERLDPIEQSLLELLDKGKGRGWLTWEEMNECLPDEAVTPEKLEGILNQLESNGIEMIDEAEADRLTAEQADLGRGAGRRGGRPANR
jgi:RNA polymerase primary sigma factor